VIEETLPRSYRDLEEIRQAVRTLQQVVEDLPQAYRGFSDALDAQNRNTLLDSTEASVDVRHGLKSAQTALAVAGAKAAELAAEHRVLLHALGVSLGEHPHPSPRGAHGSDPPTRPGRPKSLLVLTAEERDQLVRWAGGSSADPALALRSRIVLGCADGMNNKAVAGREGVSPQAVGKWRERFVEFRLDGLTQSASSCLRNLTRPESADGASHRPT
jgi:hypothetical protein